MNHNTTALRIQSNRAVLQEYQQHAHLFPDSVALCHSKQPEDLKNLAAARVAAHEQQERERLETERARIRAEEAARLEREQRAREEAERRTQQEQERQEQAQREQQAREQQVKENTETLTKEASKLRQTPELNAANHSEDNLEMVKLGEINAAKLYRAADFPRLRQTLIHHITGAQLQSLDQLAA